MLEDSELFALGFWFSSFYTKEKILERLIRIHSLFFAQSERICVLLMVGVFRQLDCLIYERLSAFSNIKSMAERLLI